MSAYLQLRRAFGSCEPLIDLCVSEPALEAAVLQIPPHRIGDEDRVLRAPRHGRGTQEPILPGPAAQTRKRSIHAARIGGKQRALLGRRLLHHGGRKMAKAEIARLLILLERDSAEELGELARREAP